MVHNLINGMIYMFANTIKLSERNELAWIDGCMFVCMDAYGKLNIELIFNDLSSSEHSLETFYFVIVMTWHEMK